MELEFFMYLPSGIWGSKDKSTMNINMNPILYLRYKANKYVSEEYEYTKAAYKITPRNLYSIIKFFNTIITWLYDDKYHDLFLVNDDDKLIFNADYKSLHVSTHRSDYDSQIMQALPTVVQLGDKTYEGIHLYVNKTAYCIPLTFEEVSMIFGILRDFQFSTEITKALTAYQYIVTHDAMTSGDPITGRKTPFD
jgi:hypothetical protein